MCLDKTLHRGALITTLYHITSFFHQLNGASEYAKSTLINKTQKKEKKKKKQELRLMFGYQAT